MHSSPAMGNSMPEAWLDQLAARRRAGSGEGITSICSAHPAVIEAVFRAARNRPVLIEATCNQVNQDGGYTGMTPEAFRRFVVGIAAEAGYDSSRLVLGGDHLGPNPWRRLLADGAMARAEAMVAAYVAAGFRKIHLDASMSCGGDPESLDDDIVAKRSARLALAAEGSAASAGVEPPLYVIGTEVPAPGGMASEHAIEVTRAAAAAATLAAHEEAFAEYGVGEAFRRVVALVVQPGVEFGQEHVSVYDSAAAEGLKRLLDTETALVLEAHSTDYQPPEMLAALVRDGFAILKVGPAVTFALREALYGLDRIAAELDPAWAEDSLEMTMEKLMLANPSHWQGYASGSEAGQRVLRHYGYSDRIRYYWPAPEAVAAVDRLLGRFGSREVPPTLVGQFLARSYPGVRDGRLTATPRALIRDHIQDVLADYASATQAHRT